MGIGTLLGIIGITISALFGLWGIYVAARHRYPGRIDFVKEQTIALFDAIVKDLPSVSILYEGVPVKENLVLIKGALLNSGSLDISPSNVETPISINLPEGFRWIAASVIHASKNIIASIKIEKETKLVIDTSLFRCKEHVTLQALAEVPLDKKDHDVSFENLLESSIEFVHRIANTGRVKTIEINKKATSIKRIRGIAIVSFVMSAILVSLMGYVFFSKSPHVRMEYYYKNTQGEDVAVTIRPKSDKLLELTGVEDKKYKVSVDLKEYFENLPRNPTIKQVTSTKVSFMIVVVVYGSLPMFMFFYSYYDYGRNKRLMNLLEMSN